MEYIFTLPIFLTISKVIPLIVAYLISCAEHRLERMWTDKLHVHIIPNLTLDKDIVVRVGKSFISDVTPWYIPTVMLHMMMIIEIQWSWKQKPIT